MKKLMFGFAALAAATTFASIESSNVVGYQEKEIVAGQWNLIGATFMPVDGSTLKLGNIAANDAFEFGTDTLQTLNGNGSTKAQYTYCSPAVAAEFELEPGWYDFDEIIEDNFVLCNDVELPYGEMAILQAGSSEAGIVYSGSVASTDMELTIVSGVWNLRANCMPVDYTLADLTANDAFEFGTDTLQTLNGNGSTKAQYTYCSAAVAAEFELEPGWYDFDEIIEDNFVLCNDVEIPAGYGFILQSGSDEATVTVPTPLAK